MLRLPLVVCSVLAGLFAGAVPAVAATPPPGAQMSDSLRYEGRAADAAGITEGKFDRVKGREILVTTGKFGFRTYDVSNPTRPRAMDTFQPPEILGPEGYWQDEDMEIDTRRKLIIGALDPRHDDVDQASCPGIGALPAKTRNPGCRSGFYVISYANPARLRQVGDFVELPAGHTASCIDRCRWLWVGGPARRDDLAYLGPFTPGGRGDGRPTWVTDLSNPAKPKVYDKPIDLGRNDGLTDYSHDVDVDADGIAWTSGRGGLLGYATRGIWRDPKTDRRRRATPYRPVLVAGGGIVGGPNGVAQPQDDFIHNSERPTDRFVRARGVRRGAVAIATEEDFTTPCDQGGRIVATDISDSVGGEPAANSTPARPYRMEALSAFHPVQDAPETAAPIEECSAHYFERAGSTLAAAWYGQGLRLIDASNARNLRQVAFFYVTGTDETTNPSSLSWDTAWRGNRVYLFDHARGIEVLRLRGDRNKSGRMRTANKVAGKRVAPRTDRYAAKPVGAGGAGSLVCPAFQVPGQQ